MPGMGPPPKPAAQRRRANATIALTRLPAEGRKGDPPAWPLIDDVQKTAELAYTRLSLEKMEAEVGEESDARKRAALTRKIEQVARHASVLDATIAAQRDLEQMLWVELWRTPQSVQWERMRWTREVAQYVRHKVMGELGSLDDAKEARQLSDRLGLSPLALLRLRWEITTDEVQERRETRSAPAAKTRARLKVVGDA